jgi:alpha-tubulin suppressor-like RCC1 family protein
MDQSKPTLIPFFGNIKVIQVSAGNYHSLFLTDTGCVYGSGYSTFQQCGSWDDEFAFQPQILETIADLKMIQIYAGDSYSLFLTNTHQVYVCGRLCAYYDRIDDPKLISSLAHLKIIQFASGHERALFLTNTGQVYAWGEGGFQNVHDIQYDPVLIKTLAKIKEIHIDIGGIFSLFLTKTGQIYTCEDHNLSDFKNDLELTLVTTLDQFD